VAFIYEGTDIRSPIKRASSGSPYTAHLKCRPTFKTVQKPYKFAQHALLFALSTRITRPGPQTPESAYWLWTTWD